MTVKADKDTARVGDNVTATATETDQYGQPVSGETVTFTVNQPGSAANLTTTRTTDANGQATFTFKTAGAGDYVVSVTDSHSHTDATDATVTAYDKGAQNARTGEVYGSVSGAESDAQAGDTLQVFGNVGSFTVDTPNITVDGTDAGTLKQATIEVTAKNVTVKNFTIDNTVSSGTPAVGIVMNGTSGIGDVTGGTVSGNTVSNAQTGIFIEGAADNVSATGNTLANNVSGFATDTSSPVSITGNTIKNNDEGVGVGGVNVTVSGNTFSTDTPATDAYVRWYATVPSSTVTGTKAANTFNPAANAASDGTHQELVPTGSNDLP